MFAELLDFPKRVETAQHPERVLENAVVRLLKSKPFYGHLLLGFRRRLVSGTHATGVTVVNGTPTLQVDLQRFSICSLEEQQALLEHAIKHLLHLHPVRGEVLEIAGQRQSRPVNVLRKEEPSHALETGDALKFEIVRHRFHEAPDCNALLSVYREILCFHNRVAS